MRVSKLSIRRSCLFVYVVVAYTANSQASFITFNGPSSSTGTTVEAAWKAAAGSTLLEDFQTYALDTQIPLLNSLHVTFDQLEGGGYPQTYLFAGTTTPHGSMQLGNFPNGINEINRYDDIIIRPMTGYSLTALGYWNGDGQSDTFLAYAYNSSGTLLGSVGAFRGRFAGFVSDESVAWVRLEGDTGDGWNHLDGLQVAVTEVASVPEPNSILTMLLSAFGLTPLLRRWATR